jgi:pSer/pThr/pTyr-binding forkhead associated (FHA) protein
MVVVMKDGALVGSEVFPPGTYHCGRGDEMDLQLDDPRVSLHHASFLFTNGQIGIRDEASQNGLFVNGERVRSARIQPKDEVEIAPFVLKMRLVSKRKSEPPPSDGRVQDEPTVVAEPHVAAPSAPAPTKRDTRKIARAGSPTPAGASILKPRPLPRSVAQASASNAPAQIPSPELAKELGDTQTVKRAAQPAAVSKPEPKRPALRAVPAPERPEPPLKLGKTPTRPMLRAQLLWGNAIIASHSFSPGKKVVAGPSDRRPFPLYGFKLPKKRFALASYRKLQWRVRVPPGCRVYQRGPRGLRQLEVERDGKNIGNHALSPGESLVLKSGRVGVELICEIPAPRVVVPWRPQQIERSFWVPVLVTVLVGAGAVIFMPKRSDLPDFTPKQLPAIRAILEAPKKKPPEPKPEVKKEEIVQKTDKEPPVKAPPVHHLQPPKTLPVPQATAVTAVQKLLNPKVTKLFASLDKMPKGKVGGDYKASGLLGKMPLAMATPGVMGIGHGLGGPLTKGEFAFAGLRTPGFNGPGALGRGNVGRRGVAGSPVVIPHRGGSVQGLLPMEAVRKVVDAHIGAVTRCYEAGLIHTPGLTGKLVLEWTIGTSGEVKVIKTKASTLDSNDVIGCITDSLRTWHFPSPKGGVVVVSYPFLFNAVGN